MDRPQRDQVCISYSHKDKDWLEKLQTVLKPLIRRGVVNVWDDTRIQAGQKWREEIKAATVDRMEAPKRFALSIENTDHPVRPPSQAPSSVTRSRHAGGAGSIRLSQCRANDSLHTH